MQEKQYYTGGCHCGKVQFGFNGSLHMEVIKCNCSICWMKQNHHVLIPQIDFEIKKGQDELQLYTFNTCQAKHYFCKTCGVETFYNPRSNPDLVAITIYCIKLLPITTLSYIIKDQIPEQIPDKKP